MSFETPILLVVFNRPSTTRRVFEAIRSVRPRQLFVAADGPRSNRSDDLANCREVLAIIDAVDWDCKVTKLVRAENLGCGRAVSSAITWFFEQVEAGIILEDDCLPSLSFFPFAAELLARYRDDPRVMSISGTNLLREIAAPAESYYFSQYGGIWGWASWRRAWSGYDYRMTTWQSSEFRKKFLSRFPGPTRRYLESVFSAATSIDTWDYQWWFSKLSRSGLDIVPDRNLVLNIGFDSGGTHTTHGENEFSSLTANEMRFPLRHPAAVKTVPRLERLVSRRYYSDDSRNPFRRLVRKMIKIFRKFRDR